ncbi:hypothetical protein F5Y18DRAFT_414240 [Xylariaceae sp. FL1019]|nr:hypothetical protein F5Y18DRAFT_414240 [Xylariaceae sp. FL1019]
MAHIAACMIDSDGETGSLRSYIANAFSAKASTDSLGSVYSVDEKKPFPWRMQNQEPRKYQLFPKEKQLPSVSAQKQLEIDQAYALAMTQSPEKIDKSLLSNGLRLRIKEHNLTRRRKVSVPELGPMTTVQEASMDSPTIPGRPALHERSISTPVNALREPLQLDSRNGGGLSGSVPKDSSVSLKRQAPLSPKDLAPLTIPNHIGALPGLARKISLSRLRSGNAQQDQNGRSNRIDGSPKARTPFTPFTPSTTSASLTTPMSASTYMTTSTIPTPVSAPAESRRSPTPWEKPTAPMNGSLPQTSTEIGTAPKPETRSASSMSHRRGQSESGSIMERGRPRKRYDGTPIGVSQRRNESKRSLSAERRAFEYLPQGYKPTEAIQTLEQAEVAYLQKQALGQAARFQVLRKEDVEKLSMELRRLDERTEYVRRTYSSLRAGRRNLQARVCQYLRSPRVAKFSYDSILKQEETLAELDASIDDWGNKLEHAENRRTRVRQKLLEHVAAAATLAIAIGPTPVSDTTQETIGVKRQPDAIDVSTPPRSPVRATFFECSSPSPTSSPQRVVARVPSAITEEEIDDAKSRRSQLSPDVQSTLARMESIRIYADSDVYALLEDVETEFTRLSEGVSDANTSSQRPSKRGRIVMQRAQSYDLLNGLSDASQGPYKPSPLSPTPPSPPKKNSPTQSGDVFLSSAVFQPQQTTITA